MTRPGPTARRRARAATPAARSQDSARHGTRFAVIDALRGIAVAMMVAYHFCYDLAYFGFARWSTNDMLLQGGWINWRNGIVTSFLTLVGVSLVLRSAYKPSWPDFWKRWTQIAGAAVLVSIASFFFAGERWIYFGILHFIAVALLLGRLTLQARMTTPVIAVLGALLLLLGLSSAHPAFDAPPLNIIGLATHKPQTEDYVPLLPWFGIVLLGMAIGQLLLARGGFKTGGAPALRPLILMGRWSLLIYLVHQPLLMGLLEGIKALT